MAVTARPPYDRTAVRPGWEDLPLGLRHRVAELAGAEVIGAEVAGGGFTRGFAALLTLAGGGSLFVKAASPELPVAPASYRAEASVLSKLPAGVPAPRLRFSDEVEGWVLLGIDAVDGGRMPGLPWTAGDVASAVRSCEQAAAALTPAPAGLSLSRLAVDMGGDDPYLTWFGAASRAESPSALLSPWSRNHLPELQGLVDRSLGAIDGETACHGDLRPDNLVLDPAGRTWICDWNWLSLAAPWTDVVGLLVTVHASGLDADLILRSSWLSDGLDDDAVDAWLALIAAFMLAQAVDEPPSFASPWLGAHRAYFGTAALAWLEQRSTT